MVSVIYLAFRTLGTLTASMITRSRDTLFVPATETQGFPHS